ncbi:MICOS complex subunit MIC60 [Mycena indigotica]|uniref:MICOS complex subunit MIC60 n=1 Tax=Mycena indigotica TaxID=2126181 RepID=A0A8H6S4Z9_9AGAR|nr:MICOS complex subunit MIC60 [Mycena indigotica]KAF7292999.1 MICOS complex subunit MIC60 [Mycena indigotica]
MYRTLPTRQLVVSRGAVRVIRRRLATESTPPAPAPKKKRHVVRTLFLTTTALAGTFYVGSTFAAFQNEAYYEIFSEQVPLGYAMLEFAESRNWDKMTTASVIESSKKSLESAQRYVTDKINGTPTPTPEPKPSTRNTKEAAAKVVQESKERANAAVARIKTTVKKDANAVSGVAKHQVEQLTRGISELVAEAEAALAKPIDFNALATTSEVAAPPSTDTAGPSAYHAPLPIGHELPYGYAKPAPPPKPSPPPPKLPRLSPDLSSITSSEPIIAHLASTIDSLTTYVEDNPKAASKAGSVVESAKEDLTALVTRITRVREDERAELEAKLEAQARDYTTKLMEQEMEAQDRLDGQEQEFRQLFDQHQAELTAAYRQKLENELRTQTDLINERLKEEVIAQGIELQRRWIREVKVHVEQERGGRLAKLEELSANLKRLERVAVDNSIYLDENIRIHALWAALRALSSSALTSPVRKPFRDELRTVRHIAAAREDPVAITVLESLESTDVPDIGVEPFADLATWFSQEVSPKVAHVALVPDENAGLLAHLASRAFASLQFRRHGLVSGDDVMSVLARAEHYLNEKDLDSAARELNQLKGTAKLLLRDWLEAARRRLEVQQALEVVQTQATLAALLVVADTDTPSESS